MEELKKQSVFMQMHNGLRPNEGSFSQGLQKLFYLADISNKRKLVAAFPEFFGDEVPEFGIYQRNVPDLNVTDEYGSEVNSLKKLLAPTIREVIAEREAEIIETTFLVVRDQHQTSL